MRKFSLKTVLFTLIISMFVASSICAYAVDTEENSFSKKEIKEDVEFLFNKLEKIHFNLYFDSNKEEIKEKLESMMNNMDNSVSDLEFYKRIAPIISMLNDGHTRISLPDSYIEKLQLSANLIPIQINVSEEKLFIDNILTEENFDKYKGCEVLSINSKAGKEIYSEVKNYVFGKQEAYRNTCISKNFKALYYLNNDLNDNYTLELMDFNNNKVKLNLKGISNSECISFLENKKNDTQSKMYEYKVIDENIALIELNSFNTDFDSFKGFLDSTFEDINNKNIKELVVDLRKNGGGDATLGDLFIEYIYDGKYKRIGKYAFKITEEIVDHYEKNHWMNEEQIKELRKNIGQNYEAYKIQASRSFTEKPVFDGDTYFLIGNNTFSAATMLSSIVKDYNIGYLIGEETGGLATGHTNSYSFNLPNTKLLTGVSFQYLARPNGLDTKRGVLPDYYEKDIEKDALHIAVEIIKSKSY